MDELTIAWIAGIAMSLIGWGSLFHFAWIARTWPKARGRVVDNAGEWSHGDEGGGRSAAYFPMIEFIDASGKTYRAKGGIGRREPYLIGEEVELQYKAANPEHVLDFNIWQRLVFSGVFIAFGALSLAAAMGWIS